MNVLIDATGVTKSKAGVGVYAKNLIHELVGLHASLHLFVAAQDDDPDLDYSGQPNVTMIWVSSKLFRKLPLRILLEQVGIPFLVLKYRIDVVHSLHYTFPLMHFRAKQVVTVHDMTFFSMPEVHITLKAFYFRLFIRASLSRADSLIFVSHSAMQDFSSRLGLPSGFSTVIHHGKSEAFNPSPDPDDVVRVRDKYGLPQEFILYVGTIEPRKNLTRLVSAFASVAQNYPDLSLVIAGMKWRMYDQLLEEVYKLNLHSRVIFPGFVAEEDKALLISSAKVFVYPSLYEGFGIPVLEALACGVPTVTSNTSALPEVAGNAALMVDPNSTIEISRAIEELLSDSSLRLRLRDASIHHAAQFTWQKTAVSTLKVYTEVMSEKPDAKSG
jgi:glycosyltransferase involved in cell wall biosynthesis